MQKSSSLCANMFTQYSFFVKFSAHRVKLFVFWVRDYSVNCTCEYICGKLVSQAFNCLIWTKIQTNVKWNKINIYIFLFVETAHTMKPFNPGKNSDCLGYHPAWPDTKSCFFCRCFPNMAFVSFLLVYSCCVICIIVSDYHFVSLSLLK